MSLETLIQRVIREVPNIENEAQLSPNQNQYNPFQEEGYWNIARRAVELLTKPDEIKLFMREYVAYLKQKRPEKCETELVKAAEGAVGYCTGYVDDGQANQWFAALPSIKHPVTGRERPFMKDKNIKSFLLIGRTNDPKVREYVTKKIRSDLSLPSVVPAFEVIPRPSTDNPDYFALELRKRQEGLISADSAVFLFLSGYVKSLRGIVESDLGKSCAIVVETIGK